MKEISLEKINTLTLKEAAAAYQSMGFGITPLAPESKAAKMPGWNRPGYSVDAVNHWTMFPADNIGMILEPSRVCVLDIDCLDEFRIAMKALGNLTADNELPFWESDTAGIKSGKPNRAKLVFRMPAPAGLPYHKLQWNDAGGGRHTVFELRCG